MKWMKKNWKWAAFALVIIASFALGLHNASVYSPNHGFDGSGHVYYVLYMAKHWSMPPAASGWETHQPPLYYMLGAAIMTLFGNFRAVHYINIFILWGIIGMVGLGLRRVFKDIDQVLLGMFALAALPMLNIFPAMITNELLSTLFIISAAVASLYLATAKTKKELIHNGVRLAIYLALGIWTKISIITILPTVAVAVLIFFIRNKKMRWQTAGVGFSILAFFIIVAAPVFTRGARSEGPSNVVKSVSNLQKKSHSLDFYFRMDWIPKVDMYTTQYYSLWGGAWNSFFNDGHNVITPFIAFHKKAFVLWSLGFILLPLSLFGLWIVWKKERVVALVVNTIGVTMLGMYVLYNIMSNHYSAARLTYEMAIVIPYSFGLAGAAINKKMKLVLLFCLTIQFIVLLSFYWILPWWHVTTWGTKP